MDPTNAALIVVDVQKDFCPGGALAVADGDAVVPVINQLIPRFAHVYFTRDWHPPDHCSFADDPQFVDKSWPRHCVAGTPGATFNPHLMVAKQGIVVSKGLDPEKEAYSAFEDTNLGDTLREAGISHVVVCGLATDYCVKSTALDAKRLGFSVAVVEDACRGVDNPPGTAREALREMEAAGVSILPSGAYTL